MKTILLFILFSFATFGLISCDIEPKGPSEKIVKGFQNWNDGVQGAVFSKTTLAPEVADNDLTPENKFRVNGYTTDHPPTDTSANWRLEVVGMVKHPGPYSLEQIKTLGKKIQNTKHICVEGWSQNVKWGGTPLWMFFDWIGVDPKAKYVYVECADKYYTSYDIESARHPQTLLCYEAFNKPLSIPHGAPCRIVMPTKLGYKSAKWIIKMIITDKLPGGYWEDQGYDWFAGL